MVKNLEGNMEWMYMNGIHFKSHEQKAETKTKKTTVCFPLRKGERNGPWLPMSDGMTRVPGI